VASPLTNTSRCIRLFIIAGDSIAMESPGKPIRKLRAKIDGSNPDLNLRPNAATKSVVILATPSANCSSAGSSLISTNFFCSRRNYPFIYLSRKEFVFGNIGTIHNEDRDLFHDVALKRTVLLTYLLTNGSRRQMVDHQSKTFSSSSLPLDHSIISE
jgi:hypothetical protein